jgi:hypothetical protein
VAEPAAAALARADTTGVHKLYWSSRGAIQASVGTPLTGADGSITLEAYAGAVPEPWATRFKWVGAGATLGGEGGRPRAACRRR